MTRTAPISRLCRSLAPVVLIALALTVAGCHTTNTKPVRDLHMTIVRASDGMPLTDAVVGVSHRRMTGLFSAIIVHDGTYYVDSSGSVTIPATRPNQAIYVAAKGYDGSHVSYHRSEDKRIANSGPDLGHYDAYESQGAITVPLFRP